MTGSAFRIPGVLLGVLLFFVATGPAFADPVDLTDTNNFADDDGFGPTFAVDVNVPPGGVTINEFFFGFSPWVNDPVGLGHNQIVAPGDTVSFDFRFTIGAGVNFDTFSARIYDPTTGFTVGGLSFSTTSTSAGTVTFNVPGVAPGVLGLEFAIFSGIFGGDIALTSTAVITNLDVTSPGAVPEPASAALFAAAGLFVALARRRKQARA